MKIRYSKPVIVFSIVMLVSLVSFAQRKTGCNCKMYPYLPPPCYYPCTHGLLVNATPFELSMILGQSEPTIETIMFLRKDTDINDDEGFWDRLSKTLTKEQFQQLSISLIALNDLQRKYFTLSLEDRRRILSNMDIK